MVKKLFPRIFPRWFSHSKTPVKKHGTPPPVVLLPFAELDFLIGTYNREGRAPDVFCLGDSVWERLSRDDVDQRNMGQLLSDSLKHVLDVVSISHSAYNLRIYLNFIKTLEIMRNRPKYIVLPINLRSFSPQWFMNPLWQFERENEILKELCRNPAMNLPMIEQVIEYPGLYNEFDKMPVNYPLLEYRTVQEFRKIIASVPSTDEEVFQRLRQIFIFHYMHPLVTGHPLLNHLDEALWKLSEMNINAFVYITPINHQAGARFCGDEFSSQVSLNITRVNEVINRHLPNGMLRFIDYGALLGSEYFFNLDNATEHLNENGRKILVEHMVKELISLMDERKGK